LFVVYVREFLYILDIFSEVILSTDVYALQVNVHKEEESYTKVTNLENIFENYMTGMV